MTVSPNYEKNLAIKEHCRGADYYEMYIEPELKWLQQTQEVSNIT